MSDARRAFAAAPVSAFLATAFGAGLSPFAPGTAGSVVGLAIAWLLRSHAGILGSPVGLLMSGLAVGLLGVAVSGPVCRALASDDPGCVVIDEVSGQMIACVGVVWGWPAGAPLWAWIASFVLFRGFDVVKPLGIRQIQALPGGWGIVVDDVLGGIYAAAVIAAVSRWV
jgi:phosphatidylglycerophosphatase A